MNSLVLAAFQAAVHRNRTKDIKHEIQIHGRIPTLRHDVTKDAEGSGLCNPTHPSNLSQSKQALWPRTPSRLRNGNVEKKENIPDKKLFSYRQLGGVRHILLCLAFVLLDENMWCVWATISIPITTCASLPWERYACLLTPPPTPQ